MWRKRLAKRKTSWNAPAGSETLRVVTTSLWRATLPAEFSLHGPERTSFSGDLIHTAL